MIHNHNQNKSSNYLSKKPINKSKYNPKLTNLNPLTKNKPLQQTTNLRLILNSKNYYNKKSKIKKY